MTVVVTRSAATLRQASRLVHVGLCTLWVTLACGDAGQGDNSSTTGGRLAQAGGTNAGAAPLGAITSSGSGGLVVGGNTTGGTNAGAAATGGTNSGGNATGGAGAGGLAAGGVSTGGAAVGGSATGGKATGGMGTGGFPTGGSATGGNATGGNATGGAATGGTVTGGAATGGSTTTGGTSNTGGTASSLLVPAQGALLGAFVGSPATVASRETLLGRELAVVHNFFAWGDDWVGRASTDLAGGRIPLITWIPNTGSGTAISLDDIIDGAQDTYITTRAQAARAVGQQFFLRWGHEMNGNWTNWNASKYGSNAAGAAKFAQAWQHIHDLFTSAGATNVLWVFCPNVNSVPVAAWNTWESYYPGDAYVDWMSFDGYNFGTGTGGWGWSSFSDVTNGIYGGLAATGKPIMIAEMSSSETGGDKAAWISAIVPALTSSFPAIKALVWFDAACGGGYTWCIDSSSTASAAFVTMGLDPYFNP